ncbi:putative WRKY transcription factor 33 [Platanthera guangdongensis]|uniref:WRKY transcription factor 33 n=1 Tax=Platanthera guangdongensis TaxID=2320717 RepID=A0ABR2M161_9ASPA
MEAQSLGDQRGIEDGYNWKKYGQKQVKGNENHRGYYKCTHPNCPTKKKVERSLDGQITEIIYKGKHIHTKPKPARRNTSCFNSDQASLHSQGLEHSFGGLFGSALDSTKTTRNYYASNSMRSNFGFVEDEPDMKKLRNDSENEGIADITHFRDTKVVIQTTSDIDILDDGYRWRKYGQKVVKGNPNPRSYYKCTTNSCPVRKLVERASTDLRAVLTTYEGKHNHDAPTHRPSRCLMSKSFVANSSTNSTLYNCAMPTRPRALATHEGRVATVSFFGSRPNVGNDGFGFSRVGSSYF